VKRFVSLALLLAALASAPAYADHAAVATPQVVAGPQRYELVKKLGNGAWSDAYEAKELGTNRRVAIKMIRPDRVAQGKKDSYDKELRVASQAHAASAGVKKRTTLMNIYGIGASTDGRRALVMEYVAGGRIPPKVRSIKEAAQIGAEILRGVRALNLAGYRHNDLHLGNIAMDPAKGPSSLKLLDVGNAIPLESASNANQGGFGPLERDAKGARADVYTVGALLYYARTGLKRAQGKFDLSKVTEPQLRSIIAKAVDADPAKRYPDAQAFMNALRPLTR
jgi:serine/threonine protein kinase